MENNKNENVAKLVGKLVTIKKIWSSDDQQIFEGLLQIVRDSGIVDLIPLLFANKDVKVDSFISIVGQFRSRDVSKPDGRLKVQLYVYVKELDIIDSCLYKNDIEMTGYVCKKPTLRNTPSGKQIADLLIECNYSKDKTAYIPVITWGREARKSGRYSVGTKVKLDGRIQSRKYTKQINDNNDVEEFVAYELSANHIDMLDESI